MAVVSVLTGSSSDLPELVASFRRHLRAANRSPRTIETYTEATSQFLEFLRIEGRSETASELRRRDVEAFIAHLLAKWKPATAANRYRALQSFFAYLVDEDELAVSPMAKMRPPTVPDVPVPVVSNDDLRRLVRACEGKSFEGRRDTALIRLMIDTPMRRSEVTGLTLDDVDVDQHLAIVRSKGGHLRLSPFGNKTALALDRYYRARRDHPHGGLPWLWVSRRGRLTSSGLAQVLRRRSRSAGLGDIHPHQLRHTFAHAWLSAGGAEGDLLRLAGWRSRSMLERYGASVANDRARAAHRRIALGDQL
jgi:site-specific recombinase XerD